MTLEKWQKLYIKISRESVTKIRSIPEVSPIGWLKEREICAAFIKDMDEATEVYNMENKEK